MWYLKVSSSLLIAVALICMIQNVISLALDPKTSEDEWSTLSISTDQIDLKKISKLCKTSIDNFNEKLENSKAVVNKQMPEPNKTTEDIVNLVRDIKSQIKNSSTDLVTVRKLIQKTALRFRDTFKSLVSFTELDNEPVNKELEIIKKTTVDNKKPLVNHVVRSFGNRYDLNKLANKVLEISSDHEKLKNNYDEKKKIAKKEFNSLWKSLSNHSKTVNDNAIKALTTFFEGMKSVKLVKKKVKTLGEDALNEIKMGDDINKLKNAVELAKALKLKFEDEWSLDSGELTYSEEQKKTTKKPINDNEENARDNEDDKSVENISTNDIEPNLPTTKQEIIGNEKVNDIPSTQTEIGKPSKNDRETVDKVVSPVKETQLPIEPENKKETKIMKPTILEKDDLTDNISDKINYPFEKTPIIPNTGNEEKTEMVQHKVSNDDQNSTNDLKSDSSVKETPFNPDITNNEKIITPTENSIKNTDKKKIKKRTRGKNPILPWEKLIQLDYPQISQQSNKCESLLKNTTPDFDNIKKSAKNSIQVTKSYENLQKIENDIIQQFYDKMVDTNTKLSDYLVNAAENICDKVIPINKRLEIKFKNDPNIKRIKYLLGKQYDPNQYILKVLDDASHKNGIGGMKKTTYYKMLALAYNLNHETKEMDNSALYAMNKIYEGKLAANNLQKISNKEKTSKACYIRNILLEKENDAEKKNKDENKEKVKEAINDDISTEPLKPDVNLDSVDDIQPSIVNDDNESILNNDDETKTLNETNDSTTLNNSDNTENVTTSDENGNTEYEDNEQETQENYNNSSIPQNKNNDNSEHLKNIDVNSNEATRKGNALNKPKVKRRRKHIDPKDGKEISEEYDASVEENINDINESSGKNFDNIPELETSVHTDDEHEIDEGDNNQEIPSEDEDTINNYKDIESKPTDDSVANVHQDNTTKETHVFDEDENLNSVEHAELNGVHNENIVPATESLEEESRSNELSYEEPEQSPIVNSKKNDTKKHSNADDNHPKRLRKRKDPATALNGPEEYDAVEEKEDELPVEDDNTNKLLKTRNNNEIGQDQETPDSIDKPKDNDADNQPNGKNRRRRKRKEPETGLDVSDEYETIEGDNQSPVDDDNTDKLPETSNNNEIEQELETPDNNDIEQDSETPDSDDTPKDIDADNQPNGKNRRRRKRKDPATGLDMSDEYETIENDNE
ncbi:probable ATP-dependent helicase PF08_0048, partial [Melanaphis sacchari]|uniref:probable ATP-dependent helicase PF08_0048 n=1 Tax=Melanaphis sacchari TaxID=742174 RepID=UPI000DC12E0C